MKLNLTCIKFNNLQYKKFFLVRKIYSNFVGLDFPIDDITNEIKDLKDNYDYSLIDYLKDLLDSLDLPYQKIPYRKKIIPLVYNLDIQEYKEKKLITRNLNKIYNIPHLLVRKLRKHNYQVLALI